MAYTAPEQQGPQFRERARKRGAQIQNEISAQTDIWALGLVVYEMLTGASAGQYWGATTAGDIVVALYDAVAAMAPVVPRPVVPVVTAPQTSIAGLVETFDPQNAPAPLPQPPQTSIVDVIQTFQPQPVRAAVVDPATPMKTRRTLVFGGVLGLGAVVAGLVVLSALRSPSEVVVVPATSSASTPVTASVPPSASVRAPPGPAPACPEGMAEIAAGTFSMGSMDGDANERPVQEKTRVEAFCMDLTEVTVEAFAACNSASRCRAAYDNVDWPGISGKDTTRWSPYCNGNKRGSSEASSELCGLEPSGGLLRVERETAAYGGRVGVRSPWDRRAQVSNPWGWDAVPGRTLLNACGAECVRLGGTLGEKWKPMYEGEDGAEATSPVGSYAAGKGPLGLLDMAGNVSEWTSSGYSEDYSKPRKDDMRVDRGGNWQSDAPELVRGSARGSAVPTERAAYRGFRCARK
jgi:formylglycine-generating enzyme required for sulfatase activity